MSKNLKSILIGLIIILFIIIVHYIGLLRPIEGLFIKVLSPVQERLYNFSLSTNKLYNNWVKKRDLLSELDVVKNDLKQAQVNQTIINNLQDENNLLKKELGFTQESKITYVAAKIITGVSDPLSQAIVIDRGKSDGIIKGMAVVADGGILIGKVIEVNDTNSKILLLTDNKSKVAATIQNTEKTAGLVEGQFGLSITMTNIPQDQDIKEGDLVVTSGLEGAIPRGLLIAKVDNITHVESEIFKTAMLKPIISFNNLSYVLVVKR